MSSTAAKTTRVRLVSEPRMMAFSMTVPLSSVAVPVGRDDRRDRGQADGIAPLGDDALAFLEPLLDLDEARVADSQLQVPLLEGFALELDEGGGPAVLIDDRRLG